MSSPDNFGFLSTPGTPLSVPTKIDSDDDAHAKQDVIDDLKKSNYKTGKTSLGPINQQSSRSLAKDHSRLIKHMDCHTLHAMPFCWNVLLNLYISSNLSNQHEVLERAAQQLSHNYAQLEAMLLEILLKDLEFIFELLEFVHALEKIERSFSTVDADGNWVFIIQLAGGQSQKYVHKGTSGTKPDANINKNSGLGSTL